MPCCLYVLHPVAGTNTNLFCLYICVLEDFASKISV
jgi:hypothetical protein